MHGDYMRGAPFQLSVEGQSPIRLFKEIRLFLRTRKELRARQFLIWDLHVFYKRSNSPY